MARSFADVRKGQPDQHTVHIPNTGGNKRKARPFNAVRRPPIKAPAENDQTLETKKRSLLRHDHKTAKTPFPYDRGAIGSLRPDQVPRFLALLTDQDKLPVTDMDIKDLTAIQNRVDPEKVSAFMNPNLGVGRLPVVARLGDKHIIVDGHHRLTAEWLKGKQTVRVRYSDLTPLSNAVKRFDGKEFAIAKTDAHKQRVFGWANISLCADGSQVLDSQEDLIDPEALEEAAYEFALSFHKTGEMHQGEAKGDMIESFMVTPDKLEAMGLAKNALPVGYWVGFHIPSRAVFDKCLDGTYKMFSIQGKAIRVPV